MGPLSRAIVALLSVCLFFGPLVPMMAPAYTITEIEGSDSIDLLFDSAGEKTVNLTIPRPFKALSAQLNVSGAPAIPGGTEFPENITLDVGNDGVIEWAFNGTGYGPLGRQNKFSGGTLGKDLSVNGPTSTAYDILIPRNATIQDSSLTITGIPTLTQRISGSKTNEILNASLNRSYLVPGIKDTDIVLNSSAALKDIAVVQKMLDVNQNVGPSALMAMQSVLTAQSFQINKTDPKQTTVDLYEIDVGIDNTMLLPMTIDLTISDANPLSDYQPGTLYYGGLSSDQTRIKDGFVNLSFNEPFTLVPDRVYSLVLAVTYTGILPSVKFHEQAGGNNADSKYPVPGCYMHESTDNGVTWTTYHERDWAFKTYVGKARAPSLPEMDAIRVDGKAASSTVGRDLYFNGSPRYNSSGWNMTVRNNGVLGVLYNMSSFLNFNDAPDHLQMDIGDDGTNEYVNNGNMSTAKALCGLRDAMVTAFQNAVAKGKNRTDIYGNEIVSVPIGISSNGLGAVRIDDISILYNYTAQPNGLLTAIVDYQDKQGNTGPAPLTVPARITSQAHGIVHLSDIEIVYDGPPEQIKTFPSDLSIPEEGTNSSILDIASHFQDDFDTAIKIAVVNVTAKGAPNGTMNISIGQNDTLSIDAQKAVNWSGVVSILMSVSDTRGFKTVSGPINITVKEVNDAPAIISTPPTLACAGKEYRYNFTIVDSDSSTITMWLEKAPLSMNLDRNNRSIIWTPTSADIGVNGFTLKVSDGLLTTEQNISVTVKPTGSSGGNRVPLVQPMSNKTIEVGSDISYQVPASDPDLDALFYFIVSGPGGLTIDNTTGMVKWKPDTPGNFTVRIRITDGLLWVDATLNISVVPKGSLLGKPTVTIDRPLGGENITGILTLIGKATAKGTTLTKVEYCIDSGPWEKADLQPDGSWSAEMNVKNLTKGNHTLLVRATDGAGQMAQTYTSFTVKGSGGSGRSGFSVMSILPYLFLILLIVAGAIAVVAAARSKKGKKAVSHRKKAEPKEKSGAAPTKEAVRSSVDSAFLVYHDGRLITYHSRSEIEDLDATLQVIKDFVKASFRGDVGRLDSLRYENMNIILERGVQMYLVVITPEEDDLALQSLRRRMRSFLGDVHERYRHILKVWDGKYKSVKPVEKMVQDYVDGKWAPGDGRVAKEEPAEEKDAPAKEETSSKRWDESPDLDSKGLSKVEKQKLLQDRLTRGEISEEEFEKLKSKLG